MLNFLCDYKRIKHYEFKDLHIKDDRETHQTYMKYRDKYRV